jgi:hypothetical protein
MNTPIALAEVARIAAILADACGDDEQLFTDMLEGETNLFEIVAKLHGQIASDTEILTGIAARRADLDARKARLSDRIAASKSAVGRFLRAAGLPKIELAEATYYVREGKPSLRIVDPDAVPFEYTRSKVEPDKTAINTAFADAEELPNWLTREEARDVVTQRNK